MWSWSGFPDEQQAEIGRFRQRSGLDHLAGEEAQGALRRGELRWQGASFRERERAARPRKRQRQFQQRRKGGNRTRCHKVIRLPVLRIVSEGLGSAVNRNCLVKLELGNRLF
jgi:hypothetical protein